jgi:hypothetical protein
MGSKIEQNLDFAQFAVRAPTHPALPSIFKGAPARPLLPADRYRGTRKFDRWRPFRCHWAGSAIARCALRCAYSLPSDFLLCNSISAMTCQCLHCSAKHRKPKSE